MPFHLLSLITKLGVDPFNTLFEMRTLLFTAFFQGDSIEEFCKRV